MGVLCSKALELEKNENERSMGFPGHRTQTTEKTASRPADRHPLVGKSGAQPMIPSRRTEDKKREHFTDEASIFISGVFL